MIEDSFIFWHGGSKDLRRHVDPWWSEETCDPATPTNGQIVPVPDRVVSIGDRSWFCIQNHQKKAASDRHPSFRNQ